MWNVEWSPLAIINEELIPHSSFNIVAKRESFNTQHSTLNIQQ